MGQRWQRVVCWLGAGELPVPGGCVSPRYVPQILYRQHPMWAHSLFEYSAAHGLRVSRGGSPLPTHMTPVSALVTRPDEIVVAQAIGATVVADVTIPDKRSRKPNLLLVQQMKLAFSKDRQWTGGRWICHCTSSGNQIEMTIGQCWISIGAPIPFMRSGEVLVDCTWRGVGLVRMTDPLGDALSNEEVW
jgi:hypothetical protein